MAIPLNDHSSSKNFTGQAMSYGIMGSRDFCQGRGTMKISICFRSFLIGYNSGEQHCAITEEASHIFQSVSLKNLCIY